MDKIIDILKEYSEISDYKIVEETVESAEFFFVHDALETARKTNTEQKTITIYVDHKSYRGESKFTYNDIDSQDSLKEKISNAIEMAKLLDNKKFSLPRDEQGKYINDTNFINKPLKEVATNIYEVIKECENKSRAKLNAKEIFVYKTITHLINSQNIDKTYTKYKSMIEVIPTFDTKKESVEIYTQLNISTLNESELKKQINEALKDVCARARAKKPHETINCPVILRSQEISEIMSNIASDLNYSSLYLKANNFKKGDLIQSANQADLIDITMQGEVKGCASSQPFDLDGVSLKKKRIVKDGIVVGNFGQSKMAQYLRKPETGSLPILVLKKGSMKEKDMKSEAYLECASFSGLQVDIQNDYIGGEVRLAYYFDGKKRHPITGISISAKLSDVLNNIYLSSKVITSPRYKGPNLAKINGFKIF